MSFDRLRKMASSLKKPISPVSLGRDVLATAIKATEALDKATGLTDGLSKIGINKLGPASPGVINAADAVARSRIAAALVKAAKAGGPLTKVFNAAYDATTWVDKHTGITDRLSRIPPLPGTGAKPQVKAKTIAPTRRGGVPGNTPAKSAPAVSVKATSNLKIPNLRLKPPKLGQSLPKVRAQQNRASGLKTPASRAAWSAAHMTMRTAKPSAASAFSAKHMKMRTAPTAKSRMVLRQSTQKTSMSFLKASRPTTKSMPLNRLKTASRPAQIRSSPPPMRRSAAPMRSSAPAMRGFRR